jgi:magnesium transporter
MAEKVARFDLLAIPVVDSEHRLLGIITHDDVIDIVREEATEDAHRLSAVDPLQEGYLETHWVTLTWKRGMWLVILFVAALTTAFALKNYEGHLAKVSWLVLFIPLVISSGGNSGSQAATLVITAMTLGDVRLSDWRRVVRRELLMGVCLGGALGLLGYVVAVIVTKLVFASLVVPLTLLLVIMCGTMIGAMLPMMFQRLGLDPALMSNPFVSGIVDIVGIVIYMNVALAILD